MNGRRPAEADDDGDAGTLRSLLLGHGFEVGPVSWWTRAALWAVFCVWGWRLARLGYRDEALFNAFIHGPLLVFHEAGHVVFRIFGEWMGVFGGTLGQWVVPAVIAAAFLVKNRDPFGASLGVWLLGVSFLDVAPYAWDALEPRLTLLGGGTGNDSFHDWVWLLDTAGQLGRAHGWGAFFHAVGCVVVVAAQAWGAAVLLSQRGRIDRGPLAF